MKTAPYFASASLDDPAGWSALNEFFRRESPGYHMWLEAPIPESLVHNTTTATRYYWLSSGTWDIGVSGTWQMESGIAEYGGTRSGLTLGPGDVLVLPSGASFWAGSARALWVLNGGRSRPGRLPRISRLSCLPDQAGGCNVSENAFRRLQLTWETAGVTLSDPDGMNEIGCHVVWIAEKTSRTHYHPVPPVHGGLNQQELYLVLDPNEFGLLRQADNPGVYLFPEPEHWDLWTFHSLKPGDVFAIAAGVAHRAVDVLACVVAVPGFKPDNELYVDADIARSGTPGAPYNARYVV